ncbi:hypothetical protein CGRA01v4_06597 [Colletotrichum graminicola]|uniref:Uncharacterized protein n=1 Tax=Colletotrichum graminicola (strain M1.001 / M2 / FGSC 10212) TaxID=645133 RepID=E3Q1Y3_COLGM|nr:uncharacterized protein GLRG_00228 [Colletotrichum graminicola M1.001]EFQ25084.1 hypothetical protein GLRG_00228 [Colletotrichum graminicola M1.001]WDK15316.1 hypothetical protein CGRA01v4_06597 [Colletotrichum graminicola]
MRLFQNITAGFAVLAVALAAVSGSQIGAVNGLDSRQDKCGTNGVVDGQCGEAFEQKDCTGSLVKVIKPDCSQACNKVTDISVTSLRVSGDGNVASTVTCYMYSDENCNAEVRRSDAVSQSWQRQCITVEGQTVKSWKCLKGC